MSFNFKGINKQLNTRLPAKIKLILEKNTPKDTGQTSRSWTVNKRGTNGFSIENDRGGIVEFLMQGVEPHKINPKDSSVLKIKLPGSVIFAKFVNHPGYDKQMDGDKIFKEILIALNREINRIVEDIIKKKLG